MPFLHVTLRTSFLRHYIFIRRGFMSSTYYSVQIHILKYGHASMTQPA